MICSVNFHGGDKVWATFWNNCIIYSGKYEYSIMSAEEQRLDDERSYMWVGLYPLVDGEL